MHSKISELTEKIARMTNPASIQNLSKLEFDLLMQLVRHLYDELDSLRNSTSHKELKQQINDPQRTNSPTFDEASHTQKNIVLNEVPKKNEEVEIKDVYTAPKAKEKSETVAKSSINEIVQSADSLNSKVKPSSKEIHHTLSSKPLKELIDLNKRFILINELFGGNAEEFSKAINQIDASDDFNSADFFMRSQLFIHYKWKESSDSTKLFLSLVKQRFGAGSQ